MKATHRSAGSKSRQKDTGHRFFDIIGILMIAVGLVVSVALLLPNGGLIGSTLRDLLSSLFGKGAWAVPFVSIGLGVAVIAGRRSIELSHLSAGSFFLFLTLIGALARPLNGDYFDLNAAASSGGYLGAIIGWGMETLLGAAKPIGLGALGMIGLVLSIKTPIASMVIAARERAKQLKIKTPERSKPAVPIRNKAVVERPVPEPESGRHAEPEQRKVVIKDTAPTPTLSTASTPK